MILGLTSLGYLETEGKECLGTKNGNFSADGDDEGPVTALLVSCAERCIRVTNRERITFSPTITQPSTTCCPPPGRTPAPSVSLIRHFAFAHRKIYEFTDGDASVQMNLAVDADRIWHKMSEVNDIFRGTMSVMSSVSKVFTYQADWSDKEEFLDVIYWSRQILGLLIGCVWGLLPLKGFIAILLFGGLSAGLVYVWFTAVQGNLHIRNRFSSVRHSSRY